MRGLAASSTGMQARRARQCRASPSPKQLRTHVLAVQTHHGPRVLAVASTYARIVRDCESGSARTVKDQYTSNTLSASVLKEGIEGMDLCPRLARITSCTRLEVSAMAPRMPTLPCLPAWFGGMLFCRGAAMGQVGPVLVGGPWVFDGGGAKAASGGPLLANSPV